MQNNAIVLDASVAIKWFHEESDTVDAEAVQEWVANGEVRALVPPLLFYEVANALTFKASSRVEEIIAAHRLLEQMPFQVVEVAHAILEDAIRVAHQHRISVYDAIYIALALFSGARLVTADKKLVGAVKSPVVSLLSDFVRRTP